MLLRGGCPSSGCEGEDVGEVGDQRLSRPNRHHRNSFSLYPEIGCSAICRAVSFPVCREPSGRLDDRLAEDDLLQSVARNRNVLWSELLDNLNSIVQDMNQSNPAVQLKLRMADFEKFGLRVGRVWGREMEMEAALGKLERAQSELTLQENLIGTLLDHWLSQGGNSERAMTAGDLYEEWSKLALDKRLKWPFENPKA
jgi:hypothetical protein